MERALAFGSVADDYDRLRPDPPTEAVEWLLPTGAQRVVDLGAGTGAMTRRLLGYVPEVVAVEPDDRMRAVLARRSPQVEALAGRSDAIPLPDASADALIVSSAWHWMDPATSLPEIARVLRDGGCFGVVWNGRDHSSGLNQELVDNVMPTDAHRPELRRRLRALELPASSPFTEPEGATFAFTKSMTVEDLAQSLGTYSAVITLGPQRRAETVENARRYLAERYGADAVIAVPIRSRAFRCDRLPR